MKLSRKDNQMLSGQRGEATRTAMRILVKMAEVVGATEMLDVTQAHIDGCGMLTQAGLEAMGLKDPVKNLVRRWSGLRDRRSKSL